MHYVVDVHVKSGRGSLFMTYVLKVFVVNGELGVDVHSWLILVLLILTTTMMCSHSSVA